MSFTTRCPSCGTVFRVVADQLKISDGWVRCGHCSDVFDATMDLDAWLPPGPGATPPPVAGSLSTGGWQPPAPAPRVPSPVVPAQAQAPLSADAGPHGGADLPFDEDLRTWFGEGPLEPPAERRSDGAAADEAHEDDDADGFEPLEPPSAPTPLEPTAPLMPALAEPPCAPAAEVPPLSDPEEDELHAVLLETEAPQPSSDPLEVPSVSSMLTMASHDEAGLDEHAEGESDFHADLKRFAHSSRAPLSGSDAESSTAAAAASLAPEVPAPLAEQAAVATALDHDDEDEQGASEALGAPVPGFVREAQRQAFWASRGMRVALSVLALLLGALLAGQWAYHQRHQLVAAQPGLKPWIQSACGWLHCDLAPVQRLDAIVIDSADLVRRLGNFYSFDIVLHNQSPLEVAPPALELTLTDGGGAVVSRRVFLPQEWPEPMAFLPPKDRVSLSFRLSIALDDGVPTAGYRALVFYP